ncbi:dethiobiotin synthase [Geopsychrobacter electrodiphilus]|uniref:dethiobiotin synthase n=1 Tax=Geopsychrobacter electrodiphilus TaxID=225196 RepID=UPI000360591F|nr:dethiobiotin synthase [Geopsychrobacter electrodiphilus]
MLATTERKGLFVTGTGTGVGKTVLTAALARYLRQQGIDVAVMKPLESGVADTTQDGDDSKLLRWAAETGEPIEITSPYRFETPAAPGTASRIEKQPVDYSALVANSRDLIARHSFTLIEGAGGLMVPIAGGFLISDLAKDIGLPLLVIGGVQLGAINQFLLTLLAARYLEIDVAGYILNRMPENPNIAEKSVPHDLASLTINELLAVIPETSGTLEEIIESIAAKLPTLPSWRLLKQILPSSL